MIDSGWDAWGGQAINDFEKIYNMNGDRILVGIVSEKFDPKTTSEKEQRAIARRHPVKYRNPEKPFFTPDWCPVFYTAFQEGAI